MKLHYRKTGKGKPLIILHGLLGMLDNWQTAGKAFSSFSEVFMVDSRNHGHSPHSDVFNYEVMAEDLMEFINTEVLPASSVGNDSRFSQGKVSVIGHSMGGKTAMKFAQLFPERVEKLVVVDISLRPYPVTHVSILEALLAADFSMLKTRKDVENYIAGRIPEKQIVSFLLKSLFWVEKEKLGWRFNPGAILKNIDKMSEEINSGVFEGPVLFLRGELSDYIAEDDAGIIKKHFPKAEIVTIAGAGHWIHADQPEKLIETVSSFLLQNNTGNGS